MEWKLFYDYTTSDATTPLIESYYANERVIPPPIAEIPISNGTRMSKVDLYNGKIKYIIKENPNSKENIVIPFSPLRVTNELIDFMKSLRGERILISVAYSLTEIPTTEYYEGYMQNVDVAFMLTGKTQLKRLSITIAPLE